MKWRLELFGQLELRGPDGQVFRTRSARLKVLLAYLALQPDHRAPRRFLAENLFDAEEMSTSTNLTLLLSRALTALSALSGPSLLQATHDEISFVPENVRVDTAEFESKIKRARTEVNVNGATRWWREALAIAKSKPLEDIDHPLLIPLRERSQELVLEALVGLTSGPIGDLDADTALARIKEFELESITTSLATERLMRVYAALGMKKELVNVFTQFETRLDYEFGEPVSKALLSRFESLVLHLDRPTSSVVGTEPDRPTATFGRSSLLDDLQKRLGEASSSRLTTLMGQSGIGKSHLLRELFSLVAPQGRVGYFDMESTTPDAMKKALRERECDVVLVDHVEPEHRGTIAQLLKASGGTRFVCASQTRQGFTEEFLVPVGPLETGTPSNPGPAVMMLLQNISLVHSEVEPRDELDGASHLPEVASRCDGIPLALEIAGRLAGSIGIEATVTSLRGNPGALSGDRRSTDRRTSLGRAIESSFRHLGEEAQNLVILLGKMDSRCNIGHLLDCSGSLPVDLEEAILSGLVVREPGRPFLRVRTSTAHVVSRIAGDKGESAWGTFCTASRPWFEERAKNKPLDLGLAESLPLVAQLTADLTRRGDACDAIALFSSVRPWLGSHILPLTLLTSTENLLMQSESTDFPYWGAAVATLGAAYFHASAFEKMLDLLEAAIASAGFASLESDLRVQLQTQCGLAKRALGDLDAAATCYQEAISSQDGSVSNATLVKCYYNLGTVFEHQERLTESLAAHESAADHFGDDTDPRVENLVNTAIGRLRYRLGGDLASASFILEATLAHARQRQDLRSMGETLQNLGLVSYERGLYLRSALAESIGSAFLLDFGFTTHFRDLAKSSFVTLCACLLELGETDLANTSRTLIDRLGDAELYPPNKPIFEHVMERTYRQPALRFRLATEIEVQEHLRRCCHRVGSLSLAKGENLDLIQLLEGSDRLYPDRLGHAEVGRPDSYPRKA